MEAPSLLSSDGQRHRSSSSSGSSSTDEERELLDLLNSNSCYKHWGHDNILSQYAPSRQPPVVSAEASQAATSSP
ncbi:hypothetical protein DUNSADRAFT_11164 [Dunaliella salina]|uniref:Encoded protein n=1 Tax=Dunaliella salina TaxID=3046 RepID=A0ABQ7GDZ3_DUNSA|nr:hypothetical protein DUNSADRAFT_11164 [Dunaliella salina]|eukprot:KAF5832825.1 hypothetical protein DUNSADRAFT_11164 [Dunaliella salina]